MAKARPLDVTAELLEAFEHIARVTEYLVEQIPEEAWRAESPRGRGRTVAAIVAHIQGVRRTFARMGDIRSPGASLDRLRVTKPQAIAALRQSTVGLLRALSAAIAAGRSRVPGQPRRVVDQLMYLIQHDAHHRGQISMRLRDLGHELNSEDVMRLWGWKKLPPR